MVLFLHDVWDVIVQQVQSWRAWGSLGFHIWTFSQFCTTLEHYEMRAVLVETANIVIFLQISTKLGDKVYIWLFNSHVKFHAIICSTLLKYQQKLQEVLFSLTRYTLYVSTNCKINASFVLILNESKGQHCDTVY